MCRSLELDINMMNDNSRITSSSSVTVYFNSRITFAEKRYGLVVDSVRNKRQKYQSLDYSLSNLPNHRDNGRNLPASCNDQNLKRKLKNYLVGCHFGLDFRSIYLVKAPKSFALHRSTPIYTGLHRPTPTPSKSPIYTGLQRSTC